MQKRGSMTSVWMRQWRPMCSSIKFHVEASIFVQSHNKSNHFSPKSEEASAQKHWNVGKKAYWRPQESIVGRLLEGRAAVGE